MRATPEHNNGSNPLNNSSWNKRQKNDKSSNYNIQPLKNSKSEIPHYELNTSIETIFMENKNRNMRDKNLYCAHHEDFGHLMNDCKDLYKQIMFIIKK